MLPNSAAPSKPALLSYALFGLLLLLIYAVEISVARNARLFTPPSVLYGAIAVDLTLFVPLLFYFMVLRPRRKSPLAVLPVFLVSLFAASLILPTGQQSVLHLLRFVAAPAELLSFGGAAWLIGKAVRKFCTYDHEAGQISGGGDWGERLHASLDASVGEGQSAPVWVRAFCDEIIVGYFALAAWRQKTPPASPAAFTYHKENNWGGILGAILVMMGFEMPAEHFLVAQWNKPLAWFLGAGSGYGLYLLWADWQAIRLRPIVCETDAINLRIGLRWRVHVPYETITEIRHVKSHPKRKVPGGHLKATVCGQPNLRLHLADPVLARGPFGMLRHVRYISLFVDEQAAFTALLQQKVPHVNVK